MRAGLLASILAVILVAGGSAILLKTSGTANGTESVSEAQTEASTETETTATETETVAEETTETKSATAETPAERSVEDMLADRVLGDENAPVTIIEYASMTCGHCGHFHNEVLPKIKEAYVETGKVKIIFRDFPLNAPAVKAAMMARCAPEDKYFQLVEVIFANQARWTTAENPVQSVAQLGKLAGMSEADIQACMGNQALEDGLLKNMQIGQSKWQVQSTPSFIFNNGEMRISGAMPFEEFQKTIDTLLSKAK